MIKVISDKNSDIESKLDLEKKLRTNNFDGIRLVLSSMVVLFHIGLLSNDPHLQILVRYVSSTFAVQAFFVVSGFLVFMSCENSSSLANYFTKRLFRIFPAYFSVVILSALLLVFMSDLDPSQYFFSSDWWSYLVSNLLLSNFSHPTLPGVFGSNFETAVNGSLWTIKIEVMFYCIVPILIWLIRKFGYQRVLIAIFTGSVAWHISFYILGTSTDNDFYLRLAKQIPGQLSFFAAGALAYYRTREGRPFPSVWAAAVAAVAYAIANGSWAHLVAPMTVPIIVYWGAISVPRIWSAAETGDFSYGLYLYHFPIVQALIALGIFSASSLTGVVLSVLLAIAASVASWFLIEKRALNIGHRLKW